MDFGPQDADTLYTMGIPMKRSILALLSLAVVKGPKGGPKGDGA